jgi:hypothetical protein
LTVAGTSSLSVQSATSENRFERAASLGQQIQRTRPELLTEPTIGFPLAVADRQRGVLHQAESFYALQARGSNGDTWSACARGEQWLADPKGSPPKPTIA